MEWRVARIGERCAYGTSGGRKLKQRDNLEDVGVKDRRILKWMCKKLVDIH
jgi:hypothetical protein